MKLDERAANARVDLDSQFSELTPPLPARVRAAHRRGRAMQVGAAAIAIVALVIGVGAVLRADEPKEPVIVTPPTTTDTDIQPAITARLELEATTVEQGGTIAGRLVVENNTERPFRFGDRCGTQFAVVLRNASVPNEDVVFDGMCTPVPEFEFGSTVIPFTVSATYLGCSEGGATPGLVACLPDGGVPLLPTGDYQAVFVTSPSTSLRPAPVPVTVTARTEAPVATTPTSVAATTPTTTNDSTSPRPSLAPRPWPDFPADTGGLQHGQPTWAVILGGAYLTPELTPERNVVLADAMDFAADAGYTAGATDCDEGAPAALGEPPDAVGFYTVSVYFGSEAEAREAQAAFAAVGYDRGVVAQVRPFCLD